MSATSNFANVTASGPTTLISPAVGSNEAVYLKSFYITGDPVTNLTFNFQDTLGNVISANHYLPAGATTGIAYTDLTIYKTANGAGLVINLSGAPSVSIGIDYGVVVRV